MKFIQQKSTGKIIFKNSVLEYNTIKNARFENPDIPESDMELIDSSMTNKQWTDRCIDEVPWEEKMVRSDRTMMNRTQEEIIRKIGTDGFPDETKKKYDDKVALRATKP